MQNQVLKMKKDLWQTIFPGHRYLLSKVMISSSSHTFSFMVLWFFLVFFKNCFRLPEDMYSVMKMTCRQIVKLQHKDYDLEAF